MGNCVDCLPPKEEEKSLVHLSRSRVDTCSRGGHLPEDRMSSLPDDVLLFILSFLTLREMVKTSILSSRWRNLWVQIPVLDFLAPISYARRINDMERIYYARWVNYVLEQHKGQYLKEFKIVCWLDVRMKKSIDNWLVYALSRKVQLLELDLSYSGYYPTNLGYDYAFPDQFLQFDLKCMKSLSLKNVEVTSEAINFFLVNCPFLERLEVAGTRKLTSLVISGPNLALKYLQIKYCRHFEVLSISNFNLVSLGIQTIRDLTLTNLPMLVELSIANTGSSTSHSLSQAASCHSQFEALTLGLLELKEATQLSNLDKMTKLRRLVIEVEACCDESLTMLISIIESCPRLEEFVLKFLWRDAQRTNRTMIEFERSSSCLKNKSLKVFEFLGYYGRVSDVELVIHIVESVVCLERIIIDPRCPILLENPHYSESESEQEARSFALKQFEALRESKSIPPHVHVLIR